MPNAERTAKISGQNTNVDQFTTIAIANSSNFRSVPKTISTVLQSASLCA